MYTLFLRNRFIRNQTHRGKMYIVKIRVFYMVLKGLKKRHNEGKYFNTYRSSNLVIQNIGLYSTEKENNRIRKKFKYKSTLRYAFQREQSAPTRKITKLHYQILHYQICSTDLEINNLAKKVFSRDGRTSEYKMRKKFSHSASWR